MKTESVSQSDAVAMMRERGIDNPDELLSFASPAKIAAACRWWEGRKGAGPGVLAKAIRAGGMDDAQPQRSLPEIQKDYAEEIIAWITEHLPDLCLPNPQLVSLTRDLYGDVVADSLAASRSPHPAAIATVIRLHQTEGRRLSPRSHGQMIRRAVEASDRQAIAESEKLISERLEASA